MILTLLLLLSFAVPVDEIPGEDVLRLFDRHYFDVEYAHGHEKSYIYHLFRPQSTDAQQQYPLIVWLHGYGDVEFEEIGFGHMKHTGAIFSSPVEAAKLKFFFLAIQCPPDQRGFFLPAKKESTLLGDELPQPGEVTVKLIKKLVASEPIDANRVTLIGISAAGADAFEMAMRYPDIFAAITVLGSPKCDLTRLRAISKIPVWAFHATEDDKLPVQGIEKTIAAFKEVGGKAELTMIEANYHNCWAIAFRDYALLDWLLSQRRGAILARSPGSVPWTWQQWLQRLSLLAILVTVILYAVRVRQRFVRRTAAATLSRMAGPGLTAE